MAVAIFTASASVLSQNFWQAATIPGVNKPINALTVDGSGNVYAATNGKGLFRSSDGGSTWLRIDSTRSDPAYDYCVSINGTSVWVGTYLGYAYRSTDNGSSWSRVLIDSTIGSIITSFGFLPNGNILASTGADGMFVSANGGTTWTQAQIAANIGANLFQIINDEKGFLYVATYGSGIYRASPSNLLWNYTGLAGSRINGFTTNPQGGLFAATDAGVFRDSVVVDSVGVEKVNDVEKTVYDTTVKWLNVQNSIVTSGDTLLHLAFVSAVVASPGGHLIAATIGRGVLHSSDLGVSWQIVNTGLAGSDFRSLAIDPSGFVYIGSVTGALYKSTQPEPVTPIGSSQTVIPPAPKIYVLEQNYPNPFNPTTNIPFAMPVAGHASIKIFNTLGQVVATLLDQEMSAGHHTVRWDASSVPSGIYFYRFQSGAFSRSGKLVLMK